VFGMVGYGFVVVPLKTQRHETMCPEARAKVNVRPGLGLSQPERLTSAIAPP
jgi:hypothetical protein